ncbi:MAG: hypothetical protein RBR82_17085 [Pseudomonas sp.]|nr:hypothetical protein [Pseudomonas sp.]
MSENNLKDQGQALDRLHSAIGGELLDGADFETPAAKEAMASILLSAQTSTTGEQGMSVSMVKKALRLGM